MYWTFDFANKINLLIFHHCMFIKYLIYSKINFVLLIFCCPFEVNWNCNNTVVNIWFRNWWQTFNHFFWLFLLMILGFTDMFAKQKQILYEISVNVNCYRNMYHTFINVYAMFVNLLIKNHQQSSNVIVIILKSHDLNFNDVIICLDINIKTLNRDCIFNINDQKQRIWAPMLTYLENMKQQ